MAHSLEKFYASFGGVDTRSNKLTMNPGTFRNGSKNFRYNFQDEIQKANGFQHKSASTPVSFVDTFEYKYRNVNTGAAESEILAVGIDGNLYRRVEHFIEWADSGSATSYSFYYDEVSNNYKFDLNGVGSVTVNDTMTLDQLKTALNVFPAVLVDIVNKDGVSVTSTLLAYLLDVVIDHDFKTNSAWYWERVPFPDMTCVSVSAVTIANFNPADTSQYTQNSVPFKIVQASYAEENFEGISSVNHNNSIYMTDGGFPLKYDGKVVYRAGMPKVSLTPVTTAPPHVVPPFGTISPAENITGLSSIATSPVTGTVALANANYKYKYRFAFTDFNGATTYGAIIEDDVGPAIVPFPTSTQNFVIGCRGIWYGKDFPVFAAKVNGAQGTGTSGGPVTLTVHTGHNIIPGMVIRQTTSTDATLGVRSTSETFLNFNARVTQVTATTITLEETVCTAGDLAFTSNFLDGEILNAYFTQDFYINKRPYQYFSRAPINPVGAFVEVYRSKGNATNGPFYKVYDMPVPFQSNSTGSAIIVDDRADSALSSGTLEAQEPGEEIPRACKYLTKWQNSLAQAGYPYDPSVKNLNYPSVFYVEAPISFCQESIDTLSYYGESMLCDKQSVYWTDPITPEGFPQDGLHEFAIDTLEGDEIRGIAPNKDALFGFKERSTGVVTGDIGINDLSLEILEDDIGLASHRTLQEARGSLIWLDAKKGFYSCVAGRLPVHIGFPICDYQQNNYQKLNYQKAASANCRSLDMYFCAVGSTWFVYDYSETSRQSQFRNCWYVWERFQVKGMTYTSKGEFVLLGDFVWKLKNTNTRWDFTDHKSAIEMDARTAWINFGYPTIDKNFENVWASSIQGGFKLDIDLYSNYLEPKISDKDMSFPEGTKVAVKESIKYPPRKMSSTSIGFRNNEKNTFVRIQGYELEWAMDYDPAEPKR